MHPQVLLLNGPNLNRLGQREPHIYGTTTLSDVENRVRAIVERHGLHLVSKQSNHEGDLVDILQEEAPDSVGAIINPGALAHYGYALRDAVVDAAIPVIEVHISNVHKREPFRHHLVLADVVVGQIVGLGIQGYLLAAEFLCAEWSRKSGSKSF